MSIIPKKQHMIDGNVFEYGYIRAWFDKSKEKPWCVEFRKGLWTFSNYSDMKRFINE